MDGVDDYLKESLGSSESIFKSYAFKMNEIEGFLYRARDAWKACTKAVIREVRLKEIKQEVLNSKKLKGYFEENPKDLNTLRHDKKLKAPKTGQHMANVPEYLVPKSLKSVSGLVKIKKAKKKFKPANNTNMKYEAKRKNPLNALDRTDFDDVMTKRRKT